MIFKNERKLIMFTYEAVARFLDSCLTDACRCPKNAGIFKNQGFGVVRFVSENCWKTQPELEAKLIKMWDEVWRPLFEHVEYGD